MSIGSVALLDVGLVVLAFILASIATRRAYWNHFVVVAAAAAGASEVVFDQLSKYYAVGIGIWAIVFVEVALTGFVNSRGRFAKNR